MLTWNERDHAQKKTAGPMEAAPAAKAPLGAPCEQTNDHADASPAEGRFFACRHALTGPALDDSKAMSTAAAKLARAGYELHLVRKQGRDQFDVRRLNESFIVSTRHDLDGLIRRLGGANA